MNIVIQERIFNLNRYDFIEKRNQKGSFKYRIAFIRNGEEITSVQYDSEDLRNKAWEIVLELIKSRYTL